MHSPPGARDGAHSAPRDRGCLLYELTRLGRGLQARRLSRASPRSFSAFRFCADERQDPHHFRAQRLRQRTPAPF